MMINRLQKVWPTKNRGIIFKNRGIILTFEQEGWLSPTERASAG